ncbi:hypothetical protein F4823DRAFT_609584 [Ustulina deusta]|nr:hypothetical protein F4823DRAFT_609584 [Ustulina deusta]
MPLFRTAPARSTIDRHVVRERKKNPSQILNQAAYDQDMNICRAYEKRYPGSDPRDMEAMKHLAEVVVTQPRLDDTKATVFNVRNKMRRFYNQWLL